MGACPQNLVDKFGRLCGPQWESRNLEGKVNVLFHFPLVISDLKNNYSCPGGALRTAQEGIWSNPHLSK